MKKVIFACLLLTGVSANAQETISLVPPHVSNNVGSNVGRFQIMEVTLSNPPDAAAKQSKHVVLLDTRTGTMSVCDYVYNNAGRDNKDGREYWGANGICSPFSTPRGWYIPKVSNMPNAEKK
jgi:hypothetical protein